MLPSHPAQHQRSRLRCITPEGNFDMLAAVSLWYCGVIRSRICCVTTTDVGEMFALCHLLARQGHLAPARWYLWSFTEMEIWRSSPKMRPPTLHLPELIEENNGHVCWNIKIFQKFYSLDSWDLWQLSASDYESMWRHKTWSLSLHYIDMFCCTESVMTECQTSLPPVPGPRQRQNLMLWAELSEMLAPQRRQLWSNDRSRHHQTQTIPP